MSIKFIIAVKLPFPSLPRTRLYATLCLALLTAACVINPPSNEVNAGTTAAVAALPNNPVAAAVPKPRLVDSGVTSSNGADSEFANFVPWKTVSVFTNEMVAKHGFTRAGMETVFNKTRYIDRAIQLMKPGPPKKPKNWVVYRARFVEPVRINAGVKFWDTYADALTRAEATYGVPAEIIVGILGIEQCSVAIQAISV